jgi:uncharacterized protein
MSTIQQQVQAQLKQAIAGKDEDTKCALRFILGEFSRGKDKEVTDDRAVKIIRKAVEDEKSVGGSQRFIEILDKFLPTTATRDEIHDWVTKNIDFATFKNKMQAMKPIMAHFAGRADGNTVKSILEDI